MISIKIKIRNLNRWLCPRTPALAVWQMGSSPPFIKCLGLYIVKGQDERASPALDNHPIVLASICLVSASNDIWIVSATKPI